MVGASPRPKSLGLTFLRNLIAGGYEGEIFSVNPHHVEIEGRPCFPSLVALPEVPDLMIVAVPPARVLGVIEEACEVGASAAIVATAGMDTGQTRSAIRSGLRPAPMGFASSVPTASVCWRHGSK